MGTSKEIISSYDMVVNGIARSIGGLSKQGAMNRNRAAKKFLFDFRKGKLGRVTLDAIPEQKE